LSPRELYVDADLPPAHGHRARQPWRPHDSLRGGGEGRPRDPLLRARRAGRADRRRLRAGDAAARADHRAHTAPDGMLGAMGGRMAATVILVHGVPDTDHVWHRLIPQLGGHDVVTLRLPGFGTAPPSGFDPTHDAYARWVAEWLVAQPAPVDVVGHDWGALLVLRAACLAPDRVRTW